IQIIVYYITIKSIFIASVIKTYHTTTLSLHDALPISADRGGDRRQRQRARAAGAACALGGRFGAVAAVRRDPRGTAELPQPRRIDRKSTRLNSSYRTITYAVFC